MRFVIGFISSAVVVFFLSVLNLAQADADDFSYTAFKQNTIAVDEVEQRSNSILGGRGFDVLPTSLSPSQNQLTQQRITNEFYYIVLLSGVALISLFVVLNFLKSQGQCPRDIVNAAGLILIIFGTIILVLVVDTTEQLTAAIGVLGAIAGYLFGTIQADKQVRPG